MPAPPPVPRPTVDELCARHANEERHTRHVTALALQIFDATRGWLNLRPGDRAVLEAAARLHDLGYASDPSHHVQAGYELVRASGLAGFTARRLDDVLGILLLHSSRLEKMTAHPHFARLARPERVYRLGAVLRVADALDHSHLQDTRITRITREGGMIRLSVSSAPFTHNLERAMAKSDLWQRVFGLGLVFRPSVRRRYLLLEPGDRAPDALRKLLLMQYRVFTDSVRRAARSEDVEALHDLRIALRCVRRLLEAFARPLRKTTAADVDRRLRAWARTLGPARDLDVWMDLLDDPRARRVITRHPGSQSFLEREHADRARAQRAVQDLLQSGRTARVLGRLGRLLRVELHAAAARPGPPFEVVAYRSLARACADIVRKRKLARSEDMEDLHNLRIAIRKTRLLALLLEPALGDLTERLVTVLRPLERRLGRIHDLDVARARARALGDLCPRGLRGLLKKRRARQVRKFAAECRGRPWTMLGV